ncbi:MAG: carboxy terminal-processing peptidase [Candidatus Methylacidiphilales bacterium]|nr:carboxy terminal-processing peptidase [Candidatus Methylacidiphilales bacterium]
MSFPMKCFRWVLLLLLLVGQVRPLCAELGPIDPKYRQVAFYIARFLQEEHFARRPIDDQVSLEWIDTFMKDLDYNRLFFLQSDAEEIRQKFGPTLGGDLKRGEITASLEIFQIFEKRFNERMAQVAVRLKQPFDFNSAEAYNPDRSKSNWPKDAAEADVLWERRLKNDVLSEKLAYEGKKTTESPLARIQKRYDRLKKNIEEMDSEEVVETYLTALARVYDPHSQYLSPDTLEDFVIGMKNSLFGIGAVLTVSPEGYCTIREIMPGGPADLDKRLKVNDRITAVAQGPGEYVDIVDMRLRNAVKLIRGPKGSEVRLKVIPADATDPSMRSEVALKRDEIKITNQRAKAELIEIPPIKDTPAMKLGVIQLPSFYGDIERSDGSTAANTTADVKRLIGKLQESKVDGLVLDLRNNGGGLLSEAVDLTGLFIDQGPVVQVKDSRGKKHVLSDFDKGAFYTGPLFVLTNKMSASASEITAGALQNYGRALIIGDQSTHGKGTVQTVQEIGRYLAGITGKPPEAGAIKLTIQKFYLPNGHSTQVRGVVPDINLPSLNDYLDLGEEKLPHALPWDEIEGEKFKVSTDIAGDLPQLIKRSKDRLAQNPEFAELNKEIARLRTRIENPSVSLNEKERQKERLEDKTRQEQRKAKIKELAQNCPKVTRYGFDKDEGIKVSAGTEPINPNAVATDEDEDAVTPKDKPITGNELYAGDLHLQETLRILQDFIGMNGSAVKVAAQQSGS